MRACATAGGGVMFVPDELERKEKKERQTSYAQFVEQEPKAKRARAFGRRAVEKKSANQAAA